MVKNSEAVENLLKALVTIFGFFASVSSRTSSGTNIVTLPRYSPKDSEFEKLIPYVDNVALAMKWIVQKAAVKTTSAIKNSTRT